jgi:branched-chain amino acid transport system permease protein
MPSKPLTIRYEDDLRLFSSTWRQFGLWAGLLLLVGYPLLASNYWITLGVIASTVTVGSIGLMILTGFTGQISLGHAAFLAVGAYSAAGIATHVGGPFWIGMLAGGAAAAIVGLSVGPFALRLRGLYLAIVTLGLVFLVQHLLRSLPGLSGGAAGIRAPMYWWFETAGAPATFGAVDGTIPLSAGQQLFYVYAGLAAAATLFAKNLHRGHTGRAMTAVRDRDIAASVMGVDLARTKVIAFGLSSFFGGLAGAMFAYQQRFITIDPPFNLALSVEYILVIVIGGLGTVFGAVAGALTFVYVGAVAERLLGGLPLISELTSSQQRILLFSLVVGGFLLVEPLGLYGVWVRIRTYFATWPFRY